MIDKSRTETNRNQKKVNSFMRVYTRARAHTYTNTIGEIHGYACIYIYIKSHMIFTYKRHRGKTKYCFKDWIKIIYKDIILYRHFSYV